MTQRVQELDLKSVWGILDYRWDRAPRDWSTYRFDRDRRDTSKQVRPIRHGPAGTRGHVVATAQGS